jgi:hypothetical protein
MTGQPVERLVIPQRCSDRINRALPSYAHLRHVTKPPTFLAAMLRRASSQLRALKSHVDTVDF